MSEPRAGRDDDLKKILLDFGPRNRASVGTTIAALEALIIQSRDEYDRLDLESQAVTEIATNFRERAVAAEAALGALRLTVIRFARDQTMLLSQFLGDAEVTHE